MSTSNENHTGQGEALLPAVDVFEDEGGITLFADLPGVPREQLGLHVESDTLTIEGQMSPELAGSGEATHVELSLPRYRRAFTLSRELDVEKVSAAFEHGVLRLRIPKPLTPGPARSRSRWDEPAGLPARQGAMR